MLYIDKDFKCHVSNPDGEFREIEKELFPDKCDTFIEGYRYIPSGESWTREDGVVFRGEMIAPYKQYDELDAVQRDYERQLIKTYEKALQTMGVKV